MKEATTAMDDQDFAKHLWQAGQDSKHETSTREWWIEIAQAARKMLSISIEEAASLIERELGGREVSDQKLPESGGQVEKMDDPYHPTPTEPTSAQAIAHEGVGPRSAAHRTLCSRRAQFHTPVVLDRRFRPSAYGYSGENFKHDYPHASPGETLERFFAHHIGKGDTSKNWLEKFWSFALTAERIAKERAADKTSTDSMGQPLDPAERARRVQIARQHARENDAYIDEQIAAQAAERESQQP